MGRAHGYDRESARGLPRRRHQDFGPRRVLQGTGSRRDRCRSCAMKAMQILSLSVIALLAGCSTPAPVRDLASRGAFTVAQAESSLRTYVATTNSQLDARMQLL